MRSLILPAALLLVSCVHRAPSSAELDRVRRPAFVAWLDEGAGPRSEVFRQDGSYGVRLKALSSREADRRLAAKLQARVNRFEISDRLRAAILTKLKGDPWSNAVEPSKVSSVLGSFLVEEVPGLPPDVKELEQLGADAVVELHIKSFGIRSANGKAGAYIQGDARMYYLNGGEIWRGDFFVDQVNDKTNQMDPFAVSKDANLFRDQMATVLEKAAAWASAELSPRRLEEAAAPPAAGELEQAPKTDDAKAAPPAPGQPPPGELE